MHLDCSQLSRADLLTEADVPNFCVRYDLIAWKRQISTCASGVASFTELPLTSTG